MYIRFKHIDSGETKDVKMGFSWPTLFFGFLNPLFKGDIKWAIIMFVLTIATFGVAWLFFPFVYNLFYMSSLLRKGFIAYDENGYPIDRLNKNNKVNEVNKVTQ